jgi:hypothetical protein
VALGEAFHGPASLGRAGELIQPHLVPLLRLDRQLASRGQAGGHRLPGRDGRDDGVGGARWQGRAAVQDRFAGLGGAARRLAGRVGA